MVGKQRVQPIPRTGAGDAVAGKVGDVDQAGTVAQHPRLAPDGRPPVLPVEPDRLLARLITGGKPQGVFPAGIEAEDRPHILLHPVNWAGAHRAACRAFLIREMDLEAVGILVGDPRAGEILARPVAIAGKIPAKHIQLRLPLHHPFGREKAKPAGLRKAGDDAVAAEIVAQFRHRTEQRCTVRRPDHRPVDDALDPRLPHRRNAGDGAHHVRLDPLKIVGEQLMPEALGRAVLGPEPHVAFIGADQQALALLPQVVFAVAVGDGGQAAIHRGDLRDGLGHEILMLRRHQRQVDPGEPRHLARPEARRVHHPTGADRPARGFDDPRPVGLRHRRRHRREAVDLRAPRPRPRRIGHRHARRIDIAALRFVHDAADAVEIHQGMQPLCLIPADLVKIHLVIARLGRLKPQLMFARPGLGKVEGAGLEDAAALSRLGLQFLVKAHRVVLKAADIGAVMQPVDIRRRVPGRA